MDSASKTGAGYTALLTFIRNNPNLEWVICENVRNMFYVQHGIVPIDVKNKDLRDLGFVAVTKLVNSKTCMVPQCRIRSYMVYIKITKVRNFESMDHTFTRLITCGALQLENVLLEGTMTNQRQVHGKTWKKGMAKFRAAVCRLGRDEVMDTLSLLKDMTSVTTVSTEREVNILAVAVTELKSAGYNPWAQYLVIQLDSNSVQAM